MNYKQDLAFIYESTIINEITLDFINNEPTNSNNRFALNDYTKLINGAGSGHGDEKKITEICPKIRFILS